jgi:predicted porin
MKKVLLGSTALVALGLLPAVAQAADKIQLGLSGYFNAYLVGGRVDDGVGEIGAPGTREHGIGRESEIHFRGQTTLDNGIKVGVRVELEGETSGDQIDNSYIYFDGGFGRVEVGSIWGPGLIMFYGSPGHVISGHGRFASQVQAPVPFGYTAVGYNVIDNVNDKISYYSPRFAGFQLGVAYTPDDKAAVGADETGAGFNPDVNTGSVSEVVVVGVNYVNKFGGVDVALYGSYGEGDVESTTATAAAVSGIDPQTWAIGAQIGYMGFKVGANYTDYEDNFGTGTVTGANTDRYEFEIGATYSTGPWTIGATYWHLEQDGLVTTTNSDAEGDYYSLGVRYAIGPGVTLIGGVQHYQTDASTNAAGVNVATGATGAADGDATVFLLGTALSF